jgi:hypothetical protein
MSTFPISHNFVCSFWALMIFNRPPRDHSINESSSSQEIRRSCRTRTRRPDPLGNLSAAQFEIGNYTQCISTAEKALTLLNDAEKDGASADKLKRRIGRARAHCTQTTETELVEGRSKLLSNITRYRPTMYVWLPCYCGLWPVKCR